MLATLCLAFIRKEPDLVNLLRLQSVLQLNDSSIARCLQLREPVPIGCTRHPCSPISHPATCSAQHVGIEFAAHCVVFWSADAISFPVRQPQLAGRNLLRTGNVSACFFFVFMRWCFTCPKCQKGVRASLKQHIKIYNMYGYVRKSTLDGRLCDDCTCEVYIV